MALSVLLYQRAIRRAVSGPAANWCSRLTQASVAHFFQSTPSTCMLKGLRPWIFPEPLSHYLVCLFQSVKNTVNSGFITRNRSCAFPRVWHKGRVRWCQACLVRGLRMKPFPVQSCPFCFSGAAANFLQNCLCM